MNCRPPGGAMTQLRTGGSTRSVADLIGRMFRVCSVSIEPALFPLYQLTPRTTVEIVQHHSEEAFHLPSAGERGAIRQQCKNSGTLDAPVES